MKNKEKYASKEKEKSKLTKIKKKNCMVASVVEEIPKAKASRTSLT